MSLPSCDYGKGSGNGSFPWRKVWENRGRHFFDKKTTDHQHIDMIYFGLAKSANAKHEIEGGEIRWFTKEEIQKNDIDLLPHVQKYALAALEELAS
jgi:hypothetical protein